jgi:hypothetical protein
MTKTQMVAIRFNEDQKNLATNLFSCQSVDFPVRYLQIPLSTHKLPKAAFQPLIDKMADRLPAWKGDLMNQSGRLSLIKITLYSMSIHTAFSVDLPPWVIKDMNQIMKGFLCIGSDVVQGGKCIFAWSQVQHPLDLGGLGVIDLRFYS